MAGGDVGYCRQLTPCIHVTSGVHGLLDPPALLLLTGGKQDSGVQAELAASTTPAALLPSRVRPGRYGTHTPRAGPNTGLRRPGAESCRSHAGPAALGRSMNDTR